MTRGASHAPAVRNAAHYQLPPVKFLRPSADLGPSHCITSAHYDLPPPPPKLLLLALPWGAEGVGLISRDSAATFLRTRFQGGSL